MEKRAVIHLAAAVVAHIKTLTTISIDKKNIISINMEVEVRTNTRRAQPIFLVARA